MTYRILDLFCGAGGAAMGYHRAGFEVVGVDNAEQPRYPFAFIYKDALKVLRNLVRAKWEYGVVLYDAVHASPPCQAYSIMRNVHKDAELKHPKLIEPVRELLQATGVPYIIENVPGAPMRDYRELCGSQFGLRVQLHGQTYELKRHRWFEANWPLDAPRKHEHHFPSFPVYGHSRPSHRPDLAGPGFAQAARDVMDIQWMRRPELSESIPPAYTEFIGLQLRVHLDRTSNREAA